MQILLASDIDIYELAFVLETNILRTCFNKDDLMWHAWHFEEQQSPVVLVTIQLIIWLIIHFWADEFFKLCKVEVKQ